MSAISIVYLFGAFQGLILVLVLASKNRLGINAKTFLIAFIALDIGYLLYQLAVYERHIEVYPHLIGTYLPLLFLLPPLFYFYIRLESSREQWHSTQWAHFLPGLIVFFVMLPYYISTALEKLERLFSDFHTRSLYPLRGELGLALLLSGVIYTGLALKSSRNGKIRNNKWLRAVCFGFGALILCLALSIYLMNTHVLPHRVTIASAVLIFSLFIHFIGYAALMEPAILTSSVGSKRPLTYGDAHIKGRILQILVDEKLYAQAGFAIKDLSKLLSTNENYLSRYINQEFGCNFPYLINKYRIAAAKEMIVDPNYDHLNLLGIATSVGFSNKNSFTRAFKRHTDQTPSSFREMSRSKVIQFMN